MRRPTALRYGFAFPLTALLLMACGDDAADSTGGGSQGRDPSGGSTIATGGAQDFGFFRQQLEAGQVPRSVDITDEGFFAEHATPLPAPECGDLICLHAMLGVMGNLINGSECTLLQVGMNTPIDPEDLPRLPMNLAVVVDVSGSMAADNKIGFVREGLETMLDALEDEDTLSIVTYSNLAAVHLDTTPVGANRFAIRESIRALGADGGTNFYAGLELGFQQVLDRFSPTTQNRVILLSDGQPTAGNVSHTAIVDMARGYNSERIGLTTIGVGSDFNEVLMRELAEQGDGNVYFVEDRDAIVEVFVEEIAFFTTAVAEDLELVLEPGPAYRIRGVFGTNVWTYEGNGGRIEIPSVFLAHRQSDDDNDRGRRGGGSAILIEMMPSETFPSPLALSDVGRVSISYTPLIEPARWGTARTTSSASIVFPEAAQDDAERGYFTSETILKNFVMLNILVGFQLAADQFHGGASDAALSVVESLADRVEGLNLELADEDLADDLRLLRLLADNLRARGAGQPTVVDEDPWPSD